MTPAMEAIEGGGDPNLRIIMDAFKVHANSAVSQSVRQFSSLFSFLPSAAKRGKMIYLSFGT